MLIAKDSPLRRLPTNLIPEQRILFEGIRYSAEIIDLTFLRLVYTLLHISKDDLPHISAFSDAWVVIDSADRFFKLRACLLKQSNNRKGTTEEVVRKLRDRIQHIHSNYTNLAGSKTPIFGYICWITFERYSPIFLGGKIHTLISGSAVVDAYFELENPCNKDFRGPIDYISLSVHKHKIYFQEIIECITNLIREMETDLHEQFAGHPLPGSDLYIISSFEGNDQQKNQID